jgi:hypothetical protein
MKTIGFFGDSFCASDQSESWCTILQKRLGAESIRYFGEPGKSVWSVFLKFNKLMEQKRVPDICVFCWTEPYRLYHPELVLSANTIPKEGVDPNVYKALDDYWKYLHSYDKDELAYEYALKYYDQNVLSTLKDKTIVQMWSFKPFETAGKDAGIKLQTGTVIDESMFTFSKGASVKSGWGIGTINHMTKEQNEMWADKVYGSLLARY